MKFILKTGEIIKLYQNKFESESALRKTARPSIYLPCVPFARASFRLMYFELFKLRNLWPIGHARFTVNSCKEAISNKKNR